MKVGLSILVIALLSCAAAPTQRSADDLARQESAAKTWEAATHVKLTFNVENTRDCELLGSISWNEQAADHPPGHPGLGPPRLPEDFHDQVLVYRTAELGGNLALSAPNRGEPLSVQQARAEYARTGSSAALQDFIHAKWIMGEAYRCK